MTNPASGGAKRRRWRQVANRRDLVLARWPERAPPQRGHTTVVVIASVAWARSTPYRLVGVITAAGAGRRAPSWRAQRSGRTVRLSVVNQRTVRCARPEVGSAGRVGQRAWTYPPRG